MGWTKSLRARWCQVGILVSVVGVGLARPAGAIYLDEDQTISLRSRIYSQASIRATDSQALGELSQTTPITKSGQLVQNRNFFNPELEAKLTRYTDWMKTNGMSFLAPDDFSARLAAWGFYDGIYDYGSSQFQRTAAMVNSTYPNPLQKNAFYFEGYAITDKTVNATSFNQVFPHASLQNPRDIYGTQRRVNEAYVNYSKGPLFVRVGKQAISWGESDTIAILDQNNPFDFTVAAPGLFEDLDEARIPLWTVRTSYNLFDNWGPLSSAFVESYWVPGQIDTNTGYLPILTASPYSPPGQDPQTLVDNLGGKIIKAQFVLLDHVPQQTFGNSRYGFRTQAIVNRTYTVSAWYYTAFPSTPVPLSHGIQNKLNGTNLFIQETVHNQLTPVVGLGNTFFFDPLDSIVRMEAEYFNREPGFIPQANLGVNAASEKNPLGVLTNCNPVQGKSPCYIPHASYLRWELGLDRFFFLRALNPTNSFTWVTAFVGSYNMDETSQKDFRYDGQLKQNPGNGASPNDYVNQEKVEMFAQTHLQSDYMHGRLTPSGTIIVNARGTYAFQGDLLYRWTDWLLFNLDYINIGGEFAGVGFFRDRDQVSLRATYQLN